MLDYAGLSAVAAVVREGSFEKAANSLGITSSAVSQRVKLLEERMGAILIVRGQPCLATPQGELICRHVEQVAMLEDGLAQRLPGILDGEGGASRPTIPIAVNADSLATWFIDAAAAFSARSGYLLKLLIDDQTRTAQSLRMGKVVGAVTAHDRPVQGCKNILLGSMRYHAAASPAFVARYFAAGVNASTIASAPALVFDHKDGLQTQWVDQVVGEAVSFPVHWMPSTQGFIDAGLKGMGWGVSPADLLRPHFATGALVEPCPGQVIDIPLFWQIHGAVAAQLGELTESIVRAARERLNGARGTAR